MATRTFQDTYGDTIQIEDGIRYDDTSVVYVTVQEGNTSAQVELREHTAELLADALYEEVGAGVPEKMVAASNISYNEGIIRVAAVHDKTISFRYAKGDGSFLEARTLQPEGVETKRGHVLVTGFDPDREEYRAYRLDRIKGDVTVSL